MTPQQLERKRVRRKALYDLNPEKYRDKSRKWFLKNREKGLETGRKWRQSMRLKVLSHYSDNSVKCVCCGEKTLEFLTLDHVNNNGTKERREHGIGGHQLYRRLIKSNFPTGFQIMCFNCNCGRAKTIDKICPHKR